MNRVKKDNDFIKEILKQDEGVQLDFKHSIKNQVKIAKTMIAFANTLGGMIVIGISDKKQIIGIDADEEIFMIEQANLNHISPPVSFSFDIYEINHLDEEKLNQELYILLVNIHESINKPHAIKGSHLTDTIYIRKDDKSLPWSAVDI